MTVCYQPGRHFFSIANVRFNLVYLSLSHLCLNDSPVFQVDVYAPKEQDLFLYLGKEAAIDLFHSSSSTRLAASLVSVCKEEALIDGFCYRYRLVLYGLLRAHLLFPSNRTVNQQGLQQFVDSLCDDTCLDRARIHCAEDISDAPVSLVTQNHFAFDGFIQAIQQLGGHFYSIYQEKKEKILCQRAILASSKVHELDDRVVKQVVSSSLSSTEHVVELASGGIFPGDEVAFSGCVYRVISVSAFITCEPQAPKPAIFSWRLSLIPIDAPVTQQSTSINPTPDFCLALFNQDHAAEGTKLLYDFTQPQESDPVPFEHAPFASHPGLEATARLNPNQLLVIACTNGSWSNPLAIGTVEALESQVSPDSHYELLQESLVFADRDTSIALGPRCEGNYALMNKVGQYWINQHGEMRWTTGTVFTLAATGGISMKARDAFFDVRQSLQFIAKQNNIELTAMGSWYSQTNRLEVQCIELKATQPRFELLARGDFSLESMRISLDASHVMVIAKSVTIETSHALFTTRRTSLQLTDSGVSCTSGLCLLEGGLKVISV